MFTNVFREKFYLIKTRCLMFFNKNFPNIYYMILKANKRHDTKKEMFLDCDRSNYSSRIIFSYV